MESINLEKIRTRYRCRSFYQLVEHHLDSQSQNKRIQALQGIIAMLPSEVQNLAEGFIDRWNPRAYDKAFWQMDASDVFDEITTDAKNVISGAGLYFDDETLFNMFNIITLSFAYSAYVQPKMKKFMGIKAGGFPWLSAFSLLYPVSAIVYIATQTPATPLIILGYGLANLAYLLAAAGIFKGTFKILGLKRRLHVFVAAVSFFLIGTILTNIGAQ